MNWIIRWSLSFRLLVVPIAAAIALLGVLQVREMPVDALPEFGPPYVEIQTEALGLAATEVEELITVPLERDLLNGVAGIDVIRSESVVGLSSITLVFEPGTDLLNARQLVQERLIQAHILPNVAKPPAMLQPLASESRVMMVGLSSKQLSLIEMGVLARWTIRPRLLGVPGVANVVIWGQREHQLQVLVDPKRLRNHRVSLQQIISTTGNAQLVSPLSFLPSSTPGTGGFIDTPNQRLQVRHILPIAQPGHLAQVPVEGVDGERAPVVNGEPMRLGDVTDVVVDHQPLIGEAVVNGRPGLLLVIEKFPGENTLEVTREVEEALDTLQPGLSGIEIDSTVFRPANYLESAIDNLTLTLLVGSLLLVLALVALFSHWRTAVISLVSIPLSLLAATLALSLRGETMNALVLAGLVLAVGVVVDDAVVGVDNVSRRLRQHRAEDSGASTMAVVRDASLEVLNPLAYATLIILAAVVPVFFLEGRPGDFFGPLAMSYALAVLASMAVALVVTPALSLLLLGKGFERREPRLLQRVAPRYKAALSEVIRRPRPVVFAAGVIGLAGLALMPLLGQSVVPTLKEREFLVHLDGPPGTSRGEMVRLATEIGRELRSTPGVRNVGAHFGRAVMGDQVVGINSGELWVTVHPDADYGATVSRIREIVDGYPGLGRDLVTYSRERIRAVGAVASGNVNDGNDDLAALTGAEESLVVRVYGNELDGLRAKANEVLQRIADVDGVVNPRVEAQVNEPALEIEPDLAASRRHGIKPGDIRRAVATLLQGIEVGSLFEEQKVFEVIVTGVPELRHSPDSVGELLIDKPNGEQVRLSEVARVRIAPTPTVIKREATSRRLDVVAGVVGRGLGSVIDDVEASLTEVKFPLEYHAEVLTESTEREAAATRTFMYAVAAAVAIVLLLQAAFGSWLLAFAFFAALPTALAGGVAAAFLGGSELSLGAAAGFLAVFGIAVRNSILLIKRYQSLEHEETGTPRARLVLRGAEERLSPIVMTAFGTAVALSPFLVFGDIPGQEIAHPMAIVVLGGLITSTFFSLFVLPGLYLAFGSKGLAADEDLAGDLIRRVPAPRPVAQPGVEGGH